ncbi:MAG TPA: alpha-2-macroglobulin family protein, partial [Burkholderiaceae bacterium]
AGSEYWWFNVNDNDRIDVLPEKKRYEPGEDAVFQVRMPFRSATALIAVEREGIIDTYVRPLDAAKPSFTIPVKPGYAPNVYVSVLVVRGRVASVQPTALVDLGKPAYKLGIAKLQVGWQAHELNVKVDTDKQVYKVRDKARVHIAVARANGQKLPAGTELAVAAVDAGLLELMPNASWNLLDAMMQERPLQVETATAQMQVIGKRHFGRKAVPAGGGGGKGNGRELFDTLLYWKGKVVLDAKGEADIEVPLNDSMTEFRIVAVANGSSDLFGTGTASVRSTQDLILMSGLPALVREDDQLRAGFTLRNTTDAALTVDVQAAVSNPDTPKAAATHLAAQSVTIGAGQAAEVGWNYRVPVGAANLAWDVTAKTADGATGDRIKVKQKVGPATPVRVVQATLMQLEKPLRMSVRIPEDALPGRGGIQATLRDKLGSDLPGVRDYMARYPYSCFEQRTSKAVALQDKAMWDGNMAILPGYLDGDGLVKYFPIMQYGSDSLTAYVLSIADESGYAIPQETRARMEAGLIGFVQGKVVRGSPLPTADLAIRKVAALEALSRSAKVRPEMFDSFVAEPNLWPTSAVIDYYLVLKRTPGLPQREEKMRQAGEILHARLNLQGTTMGFSTERNDELWWLMVSSDVNANRVLLAMMDNPAWHEDMGRLARGTLGRQHQGRWNTTVANAWGTLAMQKFSAAFESVPVTGSASIKLGGDSKTQDWQKQPAGGVFVQAWPKGTAELDIAQKGTGKPWVTVTSMAAIPLKTPLSTGYRIVKSVTPVEQQKPGQWSRGDVYRVHLDIEAQSDMTWVVVDDPIPASATVLGNGMGRDSQIMSQGEQQRGWVWPAFTERGYDAYRGYYEFVPKGKFSVEYSVRLNNEGDFTMPATRVEAMYSPEMFGEIPNEVFHVRR